MDNNLKVAVVIFHKNVSRYPEQWIWACFDSIKRQSYTKFDVFELDYGGNGKQEYEGSNFESIEMTDHAKAHNYSLDKVFKMGYDCAFNVNIDDVYSTDRFAIQLEFIKSGYDLVSSNYNTIDENGNVLRGMELHSKDIQTEAQQNNNIIAHPVVCYSRNFWQTCGGLISEEIPRDDFELWKRCYAKNIYNFKIVPEYLLHYRVHENKVS